MKSKRFIAKLFLAALTLVTVATSCSKDEDDEPKVDETAVVGTWTSTNTGFQNDTWTFNEDKTGTLANSTLNESNSFSWDAKILDERTAYYVTFSDASYIYTRHGDDLEYFTVEQGFGGTTLYIHYIGDDQYDGFGTQE